MEVNDEKFNELSQLDRIEYRQRRGIMARQGRIVAIFFLFAFLLMASTSILVDYEIVPVSLGYVVLGFWALLIILLLIWMYYISQDIDKLDEEYFKIEVKKKK